MQNYNSKFKSSLRDRCFNFSLNIINLCDLLPNKKSVQIIISQLIRSSTSIGANIVEAKASSSRLEFKKYYEVALKSANEAIYWLELLRKILPGYSEKIDILLQEAVEISKMLDLSLITP